MLVKRVGKPPFFLGIDDSPKPLTCIVGEYQETEIGGLVLVFRKENDGLPNFYIDDKIICGTAAFLQRNNGTLVDIEHGKIVTLYKEMGW